MIFLAGMMFDYLDLSDAQRAQMKQIMVKEKPTMEPLFKQEMDSHKQMMQLIQSGTFDEAKAQAIATQGAQIHAQLEVQHARVDSEAYQVAHRGAENQTGAVHGQAGAAVRATHAGT